MRPKISVIIPVYNSAGYLSQCLKSVCNQTCDDLQIIAVDDASTDDSWEMLGRFAANDPRIVLLRHDRNRKQGGARNSGLDLASGSYIGFVDSDDWISPRMFQTLWEAAECGRYDLVQCGVRTFHADDPLDDSEYRNDLAIHESDQLIPLLVEQPLWASPCLKLFRREMLRDPPLRFPEGVFFEDPLFILEAASRARRLRILPEVLYYYRVQDGSTTRQTPSRLHCLSMFQLLDGARKFFEPHGTEGRMADAGDRLNRFWLEKTYETCLKYFEAARCGGAEALDAEFALRAASAPGFLPYLLARSVDLERQVNGRASDGGVVSRSRRLFHALKAGARKLLRGTSLDAPARRAYRAARRRLARNKQGFSIRNAAD